MTNAERIANGYPARPDTMEAVEAWLQDGCLPVGDPMRVYELLGKAEAALMMANTEINRLERQLAELPTMRAANHVLPSLVAAEHFGARSREAIACYLETGNPAFRDAAVYYATQAASFVPATSYECADGLEE